jgi:predicted phosphodiesterase
MIDRLITWQSKKKHSLKKIWAILIVFLGFALLLAFVGCPSQQYVHRTHTGEYPAKTQYILVSDTHWYSPYALGLSLQEIPDGDNTIYLGDIYDIEYGPKKRIKEVVRTIKQFKLAKGDRYVRGNHEGYAFNEWVTADSEMVSYEKDGERIPLYAGVDYVIRPRNSRLPHERILFLHGHKLTPNFDTATIVEWEQGEGGIGWWEQLGLRIIGRFTSPKKLEPVIPNATRLALILNCRTIVFGHMHVKKVFDEQFPDQETGETIRVISVPPGATYLEL